MKVVIVNSTHKKQHFGCQMVTSAYEKLLEARDIEVLATVAKRESLHSYSPELHAADLVIVNAEGSIHHGRNEGLLNIPYDFPSVLINGSIEELSLPSMRYLDEFKLIAVRESMTESYLRNEVGVSSELIMVPDVIFSHLPNLRKIDRTCAVGRFVSDSSSKTGPPHATATVRQQETYIYQLALADDALLGRFHAICCASMMRVPFVAWRANTWKNLGIMIDMCVGDRYKDDYHAAKRHIDTYGADHSVMTDIYCEDAHRSVNDLFDRIAEL